MVYPNNKGEELSCVEIDGKVWQVLLMEYSEGNQSNDYPEDLLIELAQMQAKMHILGIEFSKRSQKHTATLEELYDTMWPDEKEVGLILRYNLSTKEFIRNGREIHIKINPELPHGYNHLDIDFEGNVLVKNNHIEAILDFDDLCYSACVICLGYTVWHILFITNDLEKVDLYLSEYQKVRKLTSLELEALPEIMLFRNYVIGIIELELWKNYDRVKTIVDLEKQIKETTFI